MRLGRLFVLLSLGLSLVLTSCGPTQTPTVAPTSVAATSTLAPAPTLPPTATATPAPTPTPTPTPDPLADVVPATKLTVWHAVTTQSHAQVLQELADEFSRTNPWGIQVELVATGSTSESLKKTKQAISDGMPPDMVIAYPSSLAEYAKLEALVPLDLFLTHPEYGLEAAGMTDFVTPDGVVDVYPQAGYQALSLRLGRRIWLMYYNATKLQALGFTAPPATWDELRAQCDAAQAQGLRCLAVAPDASLLEALIWARGGELLDPRGAVTLGDEAGQESFALYAALAAAGQAYRAGDNFGEQKDFGAQKALFTFGTSASLGYYEKEVKGRFAWGIAPFPSGGKAPVVVTYGFSGGILAPYREQQLAAWLFLRWLQEAGPAARWAAVSGYLPLRQAAWDAARTDQTLVSIPHLEEAWQTLPYAHEEPAVSGWSGVRKTLSDALGALLGGKDASTLWRQALQEAQKSVWP